MYTIRISVHTPGLSRPLKGCAFWSASYFLCRIVLFDINFPRNLFSLRVACPFLFHWFTCVLLVLLFSAGFLLRTRWMHRYTFSIFICNSITLRSPGRSSLAPSTGDVLLSLSSSTPQPTLFGHLPFPCESQINWPVTSSWRHCQALPKELFSLCKWVNFNELAIQLAQRMRRKFRSFLSVTSVLGSLTRGSLLTNLVVVRGRWYG